jgi:hypothetical protein
LVTNRSPKIGDALVKWKALSCIVVILGFRTLPHGNDGKFSERFPRPPLRDSVDYTGTLMAGKVEVNEPLLIEQLRRLL